MDLQDARFAAQLPKEQKQLKIEQNCDKAVDKVPKKPHPKQEHKEHVQALHHPAVPNKQIAMKAAKTKKTRHEAHRIIKIVFAVAPNPERANIIPKSATEDAVFFVVVC